MGCLEYTYLRHGCNCMLQVSTLQPERQPVPPVQPVRPVQRPPAPLRTVQLAHTVPSEVCTRQSYSCMHSRIHTVVTFIHDQLPVMLQYKLAVLLWSLPSVLKVYYSQWSTVLSHILYLISKRMNQFFHNRNFRISINTSQLFLRPPAGRQYCMPISQQPLNRSLPNFQQLLLMWNEGKVESFSSFAYW